jgi:ATP-dependent DNA helicase PIF1
VRERRDAKHRWLTARVLIIDEISMIDPEFFELLDMVGRRIRPNGMHHLFGGLQIILAGDFLQLPYVQKDDNDIPPNQQSAQQQIFLFETKTWKLLFPDTPQLQVAVTYAKDNMAEDQVVTAKDAERRGQMVHLTQVFRQKESNFIQLLQAVRLGIASPEHLRILQGRVGADIDCSDGVKPTRLYPHRADVHRENTIELHQLPGELHTFMASDMGNVEMLKTLDKNCPAPRELQLKVGAQVMLVRNLDFDRQLVNGSRGVVVDFKLPPTPTVTKNVASADGSTEFGNLPVVRFACGVTEIIEPETWNVESGDVVLCSRQQIPLTLGWATSIHKAMGMTLDRVETKLGTVFEYGQFYTSLSRVTSLAGLSIIGQVNPQKIMAHPKVVAFYRALDAQRPF